MLATQGNFREGQITNIIQKQGVIKDLSHFKNFLCFSVCSLDNVTAEYWPGATTKDILLSKSESKMFPIHSTTMTF